MKFKIPFFVAEISANHCAELTQAKKLIKCAKDNGADAVKLQTFTAATMTIKSNKKLGRQIYSKLYNLSKSNKNNTEIQSITIIIASTKNKNATN